MFGVAGGIRLRLKTEMAPGVTPGPFRDDLATLYFRFMSSMNFFSSPSIIR